MAEIRTAPLMTMRLTVNGMQMVGATPNGGRRVGLVGGGTFEGPKLKGTILPGGADWQLIRADGVAEIAARYVLQADDGSLLTVNSNGFRHGAPEVMAALASGVPVDPATYYFRTAITFEVAGEAHAWLDRTVCFALGARRAAQVELAFHALL